MRTFVWRAPRVDPAALTDGIAQIYNTGDGQVEVLEVIAEVPSGMSGGITPGAFSISRITALTQGMGAAITAVAVDTASSSLPAQVVCIEEPDSVTQTDLLRQVSDCPTLSATAALGSFGALLPLQMARGNSALRLAAGRTPVEPLVLREGEGIAYAQVSSGIPHTTAVVLRVRDVSSGHTYIYRSRDAGTRVPGRMLLALMNNTGSGVVLEVNAIYEFEEAQAIVPAVRLALTEGYFEGYGDPSFGSAVALDTLGVLPSTVKLIEGSFLARLPGDARGVPYEWYRTHGTNFSVANQQQAGSLSSQVRIPRVNTPGTTTMPVYDNGFTIFKAKAGAGIVLGRGEGLSVLSGRAGVIETSSFAFYNVRFVFGYTPRATLNPLRGTVVSAA